MEDIRALQKQYQDEFKSEKYIEEVYLKVHDWEEFLLTNLHEVERQGKLRGPRGIDVGCGPTVHRMAVLGRVCDVIVASDFTRANLEYVTRWLHTNDLDQGQKNVFKLLAGLEGHQDLEEGAKVLEARVRSKVQYVVPCDVTQPQPIADVHLQDGLFDVAISNGCLEAACLTYRDYVNALRNVATLLKPGAAFILGGYMTGTFYQVGDKDFDILNFDQDDVRKGLGEAGFKVDIIKVYDKEIPQIALDKSNCGGCFFSLSYKM